MDTAPLYDWLLEGDVAIRYQVYRDLLGEERNDLQDKIAREGWGKQLLTQRHAQGHWGQAFYQPKWISSHYTLLDLRNLCLNPNNDLVRESIDLILKSHKAEDGGLMLGPSTAVHSDVCVNGMFLNYASYFNAGQRELKDVVDGLLGELMPDGGFNCVTERGGAVHSSLHSTLSVLEGLLEFQKAGYQYRQREVEAARRSGEEFILQHHLFLSDRTGAVINKNFLRFPYPCRWKYDVLRAMDYFQNADRSWDPRMSEALEVILKKRVKNGTWKLNAAYAGRVHFTMEKAGKSSRWNTLRALRVLRKYSHGKQVLE